MVESKPSQIKLQKESKFKKDSKFGYHLRIKVKNSFNHMKYAYYIKSGGLDINPVEYRI